MGFWEWGSLSVIQDTHVRWHRIPQWTARRGNCKHGCRPCVGLSWTSHTTDDSFLLSLCFYSPSFALFVFPRNRFSYRTVFFLPARARFFCFSTSHFNPHAHSPIRVRQVDCIKLKSSAEQVTPGCLCERERERGRRDRKMCPIYKSGRSMHCSYVFINPSSSSSSSSFSSPVSLIPSLG